MDEDDDHQTFSSSAYRVPLSDSGSAGSLGGGGDHDGGLDYNQLMMTPRQRNRGFVGYENAPLTPTNPLNRETYTLQEENEASFSSSHRPPLRYFNPQSMRSIETSNTELTGFGGSVAGGGSTAGGSGSVNVDSPHTPTNHGLSNKLNRDNSMMQLSLTDGTAKEVSVAEGTAKSPPVRHNDQTPATPTSTGFPSISAESNHSHSVAGPPRSNSYRQGGRYDSAVEDEAGDASSEEFDDSFDPIVIMGVKLPMWMSKIIHEPPSTARISTFVVRAAPCFWCCGDSVQATSTDRAVLTRLLTLCIIVSLVQLAGSLWLAAVLLVLDHEPGLLGGFSPNFWNLNGAALANGSLAFSIIVSCFFTIRVIRVVDLVGAIRYLWVLLWLLPLQFFFTIVLFDYHKVTRVWIEKWWRADTMSWFREQFCQEGTSETLCTVPINGGNGYVDEEDWCDREYGATGCKSIRDVAQNNMDSYMFYYYTTMGGVGCALLGLLLLMINSLERIISKPIVQKSRESNVPAWLTLPTSAGVLVGGIFLFSPSSLLRSTSTGDADNDWIGVVYLASSALFLVAALIGWFLSTFSIRNAADKKTKNVAVNIFIVVMAANCIMIVSLFGGSIFLAGFLEKTQVDETARGAVACTVDGNTACTRCEDSFEEEDECPDCRCPEWEIEDVTVILQTQLKQSATVAAILILYGISVLRFGFVLRRHLSMYQIDYV